MKGKSIMMTTSHDAEDDNDDQDESENYDNEGDTEGNQITHGEIPVIITDKSYLQNQSIDRGAPFLHLH